MQLTGLLVVSLGFFASGVLALPKADTFRRKTETNRFGAHSDSQGDEIRLRKEWRQLTIPERKDYIRAVKCLHTKPSIYTDALPSSASLYEDFAAVHKFLTPYIHWESQFLPWHRYFLYAFENALKRECSYSGSLPYWDYALDAPPAILKNSPIFDPDHGFGGDGEKLANPIYPRMPPNLPPGSGGGCQLDGPFEDWTISIAQWNSTGKADPRCLTRSINDAVSRDWCNRKVEQQVKDQDSFVGMYTEMMGNPDYNTYFGLHLCGHFIVAGPGSGADVYIGSVDPLFYLHHANLDRVWWEWQKMKPEKRMKEVGGPLRPAQFRYAHIDYSDFAAGDLTLDWLIDVGRLAEPMETGQLLDIEDGFLKVKYTGSDEKWVDGKRADDEEEEN
jgi:tyrosinase